MAEDTGDDVPSASTSSTEPDALEKKIIRQIEVKGNNVLDISYFSY